MELNEFDLSINRTEKIKDRIYYIILVKYKDLKYEVSKRYSDFEELNCELLHLGFSALPNLPEKKLMKYHNDEYINYRKIKLNLYIQNLFKRPDIRCCSKFLNFLKFYDKINLSIEVVKTKLINNINSQNFSLNDFYIFEKYNLIICIYTDISNLSNLGKLWLIIEPEVLGEIRLFTYNNDVTSTFMEKYKEQCYSRIKNVVCCENKNLIYVSNDKGYINIYNIDIENYKLIFIKNIQCHNDSILKISRFENTFCTCSYDNAFRLIQFDNIENENNKLLNENNKLLNENNIYKIISGGKCNKRLEKDRLNTCHLLKYNNIILGTEKGYCLIYNMSYNPPFFLNIHKIKNDKKITCFTNSDKYLFIGYHNTIACYNYEYITENKIIDNEKNNENSSIQSIQKQKYIQIKKFVLDNNISGQYIHPSIYDNKILSLCINKQKKILYAGYEFSIIIWSIMNGSIISSFQAHSNGVFCLKYLKDCDYLVSSGYSGSLKVWKSNLDNYEFWNNKKKLKKNENNKIDNNFYFNESDDDKINENNNSESDLLTNQLNYEIYDTSNYKKDIISYNDHNKFYSNESNRISFMYKNSNEPYINENDISKSLNQNYNLDDNNNNLNYNDNIYENYNLENNLNKNNLKTDTKNVNFNNLYDINLNEMNNKNINTNFHYSNINDLTSINNNEMSNLEFISKKNNYENNLNTSQQINNHIINTNDLKDVTKKENLNMNKNIVYVNDDDDDDDNDNDLINAFK